LAASRNQIGHRLGLHEVKLLIEKSALSKLPRAGKAHRQLR
jgi:hypothetical protein